MCIYGQSTQLHGCITDHSNTIDTLSISQQRNYEKQTYCEFRLVQAAQVGSHLQVLKEKRNKQKANWNR